MAGDRSAIGGLAHGIAKECTKHRALSDQLPVNPPSSMNFPSIMRAIRSIPRTMGWRLDRAANVARAPAIS